ncbi:transcription factor [Ganoderma sinense ZZ0214-1]|uniref:Transcription factor n=1 Tax=Ganoderma sinense ZZ0214-1 TaxID=1077348 RepID=A0A2G8S176_9APHY|nr:transcription factor [Ganoderma sinense ZZ0214-1]
MSDSATLSSVLESQAALVQEAALALPHQFTQCTYSLGPIRQAVYLCLTCTPATSPESPRGICAACSIACHTDHEQLELFPKRAFQCDCPTRALAHACTLHTAEEAPNDKNQYSRNFRAQFCRCGRAYDAEKERETMIQCVACEDWFHESCLNLRERPPSREPTPEPPVDDDDYDGLVCSDCVRKIDALRKIAGTPGALMVVRSSEGDSWRIIGVEETDSVLVDTETKDARVNGKSEEVLSTGVKREREGSVGAEPSTKRARVSPDAESAPCLAPPQGPRVKDLLCALDGSPNGDAIKKEEESLQPEKYLGAGDVFLTEGWRDRWCRCKNCLPSLEARPYLLEEEETYEPPEDPDSGLSLEELGMRALNRLPRERAINGIMAFNAMRDDLMQHLRPFAERGTEVTEADIRGFFDARIQELQSKRRTQ